jgi:hypothetical protein
MAVLSKPVSEPVIDVDDEGRAVYHPVEINCKRNGKNALMWKVEEHEIAVQFLKQHVPVRLLSVID